MKILDHKIIYREKRFHAAFPSIVRCSDDKLLLAFRRARDGLWLIPEEKRKDIDVFNRMDHIDSRSHIVLMELDASGEKQDAEPDMLPIDPEAADQYGALLSLPDDKIFMSSFSWYPLPSDSVAHLAGRVPPGEQYVGCRYLYWGSHTSLRERASGKWITHHRYILPDGGYGRTLSPDDSKALVAPVGGKACWVNGKILLALYGGVKEGCALFESADSGETWRYRSLIARDESGKITFQEPALCEDGRGGLVCFMRTAGADGRLATSRSKDGVQWSEPKLHDLIGHPFHPLQLTDGSVLLSYGYRAAPYGIRARLLADPLTNPDEVEEVVIREDGLCPDIGYPWGVELRDGRVLLCYYWTDAEGIRHIVGTWLELND